MGTKRCWICAFNYVGGFIKRMMFGGLMLGGLINEKRN